MWLYKGTSVWSSTWIVCRSIVSFASEYNKRGLPLHVLVENAGVFLVPHDHTQEGFETTVGTNYFGEPRHLTPMLVLNPTVQYHRTQQPALT
jgi:hypothetical protein